jgi:hypothetical protein
MSVSHFQKQGICCSMLPLIKYLLLRHIKLFHLKATIKMKMIKMEKLFKGIDKTYVFEFNLATSRG